MTFQMDVGKHMQMEYSASDSVFTIYKTSGAICSTIN